MSCRIEGIEIESFRGIRRLSLPVEGRNLIVVGENGSGKSSIVDAIEFFFTGGIQHLEGRADVNQRACVPNVMGGVPRVMMTLSDGSSMKEVSLIYGRRDEGMPESMRPFFEGAARRPLVLRRQQILRFVNARDAGRYEQISELVGLGDLDEAERRWGKVRRRAEGVLEELETERERILGRLTRLLGGMDEVSDEEGVARLVSDELGMEGADRLRGPGALMLYLEKERRKSVTDGAAEVREALRDLHETTGEAAEGLGRWLEGRESLERALREFRRMANVVEDAALEALLVEGQRVLQAWEDGGGCPLCEGLVEDHAALLRRLGERVRDVREVTEARRRVREEQAALRAGSAPLRKRLVTLGVGLRDLDFPHYLQPARAAVRCLDGYRVYLEKLDGAEGAGEDLPDVGPLRAFRECVPEIAYEISERRQALGGQGREDGQIDHLVRMTRVHEQWARLRELEPAMREARFAAGQTAMVHEELVEARKRGLDRLRAELEGEFGRLYGRLHPEEGYAAITMPVQRSRRSSVALRARYLGEGAAHPLNTFSDGHLDSLGLCVFLAFMERSRGDLDLMVLDDVLTTMDAEHRLRVARMLGEVFGGYQLVITTHDPAWAEVLAEEVPGSELVALRRWTAERGVGIERRDRESTE